MAHLNERTLRSYTDLRFKSRRLYESARSAEAAGGVSIFLSHSHRDRAIVEGIINYISQNTNSAIYVDWQDSDLPRETSGVTARAVKTKIAELPKFVVLATRNALTSRWVPWEIGVADAKKTLNDILIIPVDDDDGHFAGNEYLSIYNRLEIPPTYTTQSSVPQVVSATNQGSTIGVSLANWLAS